MSLEHYRQPHTGDSQSRKDIFDCFTELHGEDGVEFEDLPVALLEYFDNITLQEATTLFYLWEKQVRALKEAFGIW